jgi:cell division protein FtsQ
MMSVAIPPDLAQAVRSGNLFSNRGTSVLDAPEPDRVSMGTKSVAFKRRAAVTEMPLRRDSSHENDYADDFGDGNDGEFVARPRRQGVRVSFRGGLVPKTLWGRIAAGGCLLVLSAAAIAAALWVRSFLLHDEHFLVPSSESIQVAGNSHLTRAQLLSVFGEDVDRNVFEIPLAERRAELESLPWVAHATVMRLLPNRVRVAIVERTPVAFVRQGTQIGLVDVNGVLFDLPGPETGDGATAASSAQYSFPVLTGISTGDPLSTRAARMKIYMDFVSALDATGEGISHKLSEVDLSDPEDVRALLPDAGSGNANAGADILVHFGEDKFLERYHQYMQHLPEWRAQYPKLASADMRYERQVVLAMQPGTPAPSGDAAPAASGKDATPAAPAKAAAKTKVAPAKRGATKKQQQIKLKKLKGKPAGTASKGSPR